jgi:hypothetical protein
MKPPNGYKGIKEYMKKIIVGVALVAFAWVSAVQAGEGKEGAKKKTSVADKAKTECTEKANVNCADKTSVTCTEKDKSAQSACGTACCAKDKFTRKTVKPAEKGGMLLANR